MDYKFIVRAEEKDLSLQKFLRQALPNYPSLKALRKLLEENSCRLNGKCERFGSIKLQPGDEIVFYYPKTRKPLLYTPLYEDEFLVVFNKEPKVSSEDSKFRTYFPVHRLDKGTSGAIVFAKNPKIQKALIEQFKTRKVQKLYLAMTTSSPQKESGTLSTHYGKKRLFQGQAIWGAVDDPSLPLAITSWWLLQKNTGHSLFAAKPITGKTHQIRSHLSLLGCPLIGDVQYGFSPKGSILSTKPLLHSYLLSFFHPILGKSIEIKAPLEQEFAEMLQKLFNQSPDSIDECLIRKNVFFR